MNSITRKAYGSDGAVILVQSPATGQPEIASYYVQIYHGDEVERRQAEWLREPIGERFRLRLDNWRDEPVGSHAGPGLFATENFARLVPWLMLNHGGILIYPIITNPKRDHLIDPIWIGRALGVHGEVLGEEDEA